MATFTVSNHFKFQLISGNIDFDTDQFKIMLMATAFVYNKDTHATYADVSASELAAGNGYTATGDIIGASAPVEDDTNDRGSVDFNTQVWTASGGNIGPASAAILYDDTTADDTIVGCIEFTSDITAADGEGITIDNMSVRVS